jgi:hypothetical protein
MPFDFTLMFCRFSWGSRRGKAPTRYCLFSKAHEELSTPRFSVPPTVPHAPCSASTSPLLPAPSPFAGPFHPSCRRELLPSNLDAVDDDAPAPTPPPPPPRRVAVTAVALPISTVATRPQLSPNPLSPSWASPLPPSWPTMSRNLAKSPRPAAASIHFIPTESFWMVLFTQQTR